MSIDHRQISLVGKPGSLAPTADFQLAAGARAMHRPKVMFVAGSEAETLELRTLLRRRLLLIALAASMASGLSATQKFLSFESTTWENVAWQLRHWPDLGIGVAYVFVYAAIAGILWKGGLPTLLRLRFYELLIFSGGLLSCSINNWYVLNTGGWLSQLIGLNHLNLLASAMSINWFFLIVAYGTLIPNTAHRCAMVVGFMALLGLGLTARSLAANNVASADAVRFLVQMGIWMMLAVGIATIGSHRLEVLRQAASAARQLGQYQLRERLGTGGMGEVYRAEHLLLRRPCAVKLIRRERGGDAQSLLRFEREVQATATLSHPNTVQIYDYGHADDGTFYYAMEYLPGLTLEQLVEQQGPLPPARAIHFLRQICGSLSEAHAIGLIHRDIKPANVMICRRGGIDDVAKVLDFGLVRPVGNDGREAGLTQEGLLAGTPEFMSPEQAAGEQTLDARSDLYSVGALGYFLLTGQSPFARRPALKMLAAHQYETPPSLSQHGVTVPANLEAVIMRCLAKSPDERFADAEALAAALTGCGLEAC